MNISIWTYSRRASRHSRHGRSRYAPTTESRLSRAIALDGREGAQTRASRYSEYRRESGRPTMVSSVLSSPLKPPTKKLSVRNC